MALATAASNNTGNGEFRAACLCINTEKWWLIDSQPYGSWTTDELNWTKVPFFGILNPNGGNLNHPSSDIDTESSKARADLHQ
ncbi:putative exopolygalacturonase B [Fusarium oxysporum f. sp. albedinis]|jgi:hypothetical protein|nr:putative exopolygalacturonase B [Fusarium oxysporum f. sp. albedinis]KAK2480779.1 hypothetical protein H9L39_06418 [Fusarium oxysporum f. sp. albedinis]